MPEVRGNCFKTTELAVGIVHRQQVEVWQFEHCPELLPVFSIDSVEVPAGYEEKLPEDNGVSW